jgi:hypothetical protein
LRYLSNYAKNKQSNRYDLKVICPHRNFFLMGLNDFICLAESGGYFLVHPRELFKDTIAHSAPSVVLADNHPPGVSEPSEDDLIITKRRNY